MPKGKAVNTKKAVKTGKTATARAMPKAKGKTKTAAKG
jgi:hypothetical protein